jgi:hypothetical protein
MTTTVTLAGVASGTHRVTVGPYNQPAMDIMYIVTSSTLAAVPSLSDIAGNVFAGNSFLSADGSHYLQVWYAENCLGNTANVVTVTGGGLSAVNATYYDIAASQNPTIDILGAFATTTPALSSSVTASINNSSPNDVIIATLFDEDQILTSATAPSGFTQDAGSLLNGYCMSAWIVNAGGAGTYNVTWSNVVAPGTLDMVISSFDPAPGSLSNWLSKQKCTGLNKH